MTKEQLHKNHPYVSVSPNVANAWSVIATLTVPAGRVYRLLEGTPLVLKLSTSSTEISGASQLYLGWKAPVGETIYQIGKTMPYMIFRNISLENQYSVETISRRVIEFDSEELERASRGEVSVITGLTADYKLVLVLNSPDVVDWTNANSDFLIEVQVLTEQEFSREQGK